MGIAVTCLDVCRVDEAWRLEGVRGRARYLWKASNDIVPDDLRGVDVVIDAGLGVADRPLGGSSPGYTSLANLLPPLRILEVVSGMDRMPSVIYPSSFNTLYGHPRGQRYSARMLPSPSSPYGWTKAAAELLYMSYHRSHGVPCVVTRVGSGYGPRMRSDELPARLALDVIRGRDVELRSPGASRLWTFGPDIVDFYGRLVERVGEYVGQTLHCAGNADGRIVTNMELAELVAGFGSGGTRITAGEYERGEMIGGRPVSFEVEEGPVPAVEAAVSRSGTAWRGRSGGSRRTWTGTAAAAAAAADPRSGPRAQPAPTSACGARRPRPAGPHPPGAGGAPAPP